MELGPLNFGTEPLISNCFQALHKKYAQNSNF